MISVARVITATASPRLRQRYIWTCSIIGHVATTSVVAQINAGRNGHKIQNEVAIRPPTKRTARVLRVSSEGASIQRRGGRPPGALGSVADHQLQAVSVGVAEINAAIFARTSADGDAALFQLGFQRLVAPDRDVERQVVEILSGGERRAAGPAEKRDSLVPGVQEDLPIIFPVYGHAEYFGVKPLRTLHVTDVKHDVIHPARFYHSAFL
jgi:hypothetical protein